MKLKGKTALVTGGNRGIGFEVCRQIAQEGARVLLGSRNRERGQKAAADLVGNGLDVSPIELDVAEIDSIHAVAREFKNNVDILVNNAAILDQGEFFSLRDSELDLVIRTNMRGPILLSQLLSGGMRDRKWGRIVNVTSGMGAISRRLGSDSVGYRLTKLALNGFTICLADALQGTGVLVNSVDPGWVKTAMGGPGARKTPEEGAKGIVAAVLLPDHGPNGFFFRDGRKVDW